MPGFKFEQKNNPEISLGVINLMKLILPRAAALGRGCVYAKARPEHDSELPVEVRVVWRKLSLFMVKSLVFISAICLIELSLRYPDFDVKTFFIFFIFFYQLFSFQCLMHLKMPLMSLTVNWLMWNNRTEIY